MNASLKQILVFALGGIILVIFSFPINNWWYEPGIDPPLLWLFNYFFSNGLSQGKEILFPHGPLAFVMYPLSENIFIARIFHSILIISIFLLTQNSVPAKDWNSRFIPAFIFTLIIGLVAPINHLIIATLLLLYVNAHRHKKEYFILMALLLTAIAFYIKAYIAILSGIIWLSYLIHQSLEYKNYKKLILQSSLLASLIGLTWLIMYQSFGGFFRYIFGMIQLAQDNSAAAAYYPDNNWLMLGIFFLCLGFLFFYKRTKSSIFFSWLFLLSFFGAWKHGMAREDMFHLKGLFLFVIIGLGIFLLSEKTNRTKNFIFSLLALLTFSLNMKNAENYFSLQVDWMRSHHFVDFVNHFKTIDKENQNIIRNKNKTQVLSKETLDLIQSANVDAYPWDYTPIPTNRFNFKPRVIPQSYASYTSWLDKQNALHFENGESADYIIWDFATRVDDLNGSLLNSIDNRYLLNDEPQTILQIISRYEPLVREGRFGIYRKRNKALDFSTVTTEWQSGFTNQWIDVPTSDNSKIQRIKLKLRASIVQKLKSFFYKDDQVWVFYRTKLGSILKYRIVPKNAEDGLWLNPLILSSEEKHEIVAYMLVPTAKTAMHKPFDFAFEKIEFEKDENQALSFFQVDQKTSARLLYQSIETFDADSVANWSIKPNWKDNSISFSGTFSILLPPGAYSPTLSLELDSFVGKRIKAFSEVWIKTKSTRQSKDILSIISLEQGSKNHDWKGISLGPQILIPNDWNHISNHLSCEPIPSQVLKVFLWNQSQEAIYIDDFQLSIFGELEIQD